MTSGLLPALIHEPRILKPGRMLLHWSPRRVQLRGRARNPNHEPDRKEDSLDRGSNKAEREAAFQKLQSERVAKNLEEDRERDAEERQERKQIRQDEVRCLLVSLEKLGQDIRPVSHDTVHPVAKQAAH